MTKPQELRDQSLEELEALHLDSCKELFKLKNRTREEKLEKPHIIHNKRKEIARILTIINEKKNIKK